MKHFLIILMLGAGLWACDSDDSSYPPAGTYRGVLSLKKGVELPFLFRWDMASDTPMVILNGGEAIPLIQQDILTKGDSLQIRMPVFESFFLIDAGEDVWTGEWRDPSRGPDYAIPFWAELSGNRFDKEPAGSKALPATWAVRFSPDTEGEYPAVGKLAEDEGNVSGTFLTETGDYRFLEGVRSGDSLWMSAFDGAHAFLFAGKLRNDSITGAFYSGNHWEEPWVAVADDTVTLRAAESLTYLKPGYDGIRFAFPDLHGDTVRYPSPRFDNKVVVVQLLGSWCPNCMDETRLLAEWYDRYQSRGLEIIGLAFERRPNMAEAVTAVGRMADRLEADYPMLIASLTTSKTAAAEQLPMLSAVLSYPTSIWIDRSGHIRRIHTGFNGPGTGAPYEAFVEEYEALIQEMLEE